MFLSTSPSVFSIISKTCRWTLFFPRPSKTRGSSWSVCRDTRTACGQFAGKRALLRCRCWWSGPDQRRTVRNSCSFIYTFIEKFLCWIRTKTFRNIKNSPPMDAIRFSDFKNLGKQLLPLAEDFSCGFYIGFIWRFYKLWFS